MLPRIEAVHPEVARALRAMSGMERLRLAHETWELTRQRLAGYLMARHPDWRQDEIEKEIARRLVGDDVLWEEVQNKWSTGR